MKRIAVILLVALLCVSLLPVGTAAEGPTPAPQEAKYVDFDDMSFWVNGEKFTLGVTTLQDMIDAGVVFDAVDLEDADNNLRKNTQSETFKFYITEHLYGLVKVMNDTDKGKRLADCPLRRLYVTLSDHPEELDASILTMAFPLDLTLAQLAEHAGEPDDKSHYDGSKYVSDTYTYQKSGRRYFGYNEFSFTFHDGVLDYFSIDYIP